MEETDALVFMTRVTELAENYEDMFSFIKDVLGAYGRRWLGRVIKWFLTKFRTGPGGQANLFGNDSYTNMSLRICECF